MEIADNRQPKRPPGWMKPYWAKAGWYAAAVLLSFVVSLLVVDFGVGILLHSAIDAQPIVWRIVDVVLDVFIAVGVTLYFSTRDGYAKRSVSHRTDVLGGLLFMGLQVLVALPTGAIYITGHLPYSLASLIYFGNSSIFEESLGSAPPALILLCMLAAVPLVYVPAMMVGARLGVRQYQQEIDELKEDHERRK